MARAGALAAPLLLRDDLRDLRVRPRAGAGSCDGIGPRGVPRRIARIERTRPTKSRTRSRRRAASPTESGGHQPESLRVSLKPLGIDAESEELTGTGRYCFNLRCHVQGASAHGRPQCYDESRSPEEFSLHTDAASTAPPDAFGPFRVLHQIGAGASGPVFRAYDPDDDRLVAVKLFRLDLPPEQVHRLVAELERLIAVEATHPAIVAPIATGMVGVTAYLAQDYVAAESLDITARQGFLAPSTPCAIRRAAGRRARRRRRGGHRTRCAASARHPAVGRRGPAHGSGRRAGAGAHRGADAGAAALCGARTDRRDPRGIGGRTSSAWPRSFTKCCGRAASPRLGDEAAASLTEIAGGDLARLRAVFGRALANDPGTRFDTALEFAGALEGGVLRQQPHAVSGLSRTAPDVSPSRTDRDEASAESDRRHSTPSARDQRTGDARRQVEEKAPEPVLVRGDFESPRARTCRRYADLESAPAVAYQRRRRSSRPRDGCDGSYRVAPDGALDSGRPRSSVAPLAFALVIGAALGFAAGFGVGTRGRSEAPGEASMAAATRRPRMTTVRRPRRGRRASSRKEPW